MLVGITGERIERQALFAYSDMFTLDKKGQLTKKHIIKEIIPRLLSVLEKEDLLVEKEGELPYMKATILLAYKDTLYEICENFTIIKYEDFQVLGRVADYAHATMLNTSEGDDIEERIVKALNIVAKNSQCVGNPYLLVNTKDLEYKLIRREYEN